MAQKKKTPAEPAQLSEVRVFRTRISRFRTRAIFRKFAATGLAYKVFTVLGQVLKHIVTIANFNEVVNYAKFHAESTGTLQLNDIVEKITKLQANQTHFDAV